MATRKRLSDVLRQEAKQVPDAKEKPVIDTTAEEVLEQDGQEKELSLDMPDPNHAKHTSSTQSDLEATIAELKAALAQAQQKESTLLERVSDLQSELHEQKKLLQKLQKDKDQAHLKSELEQAKKDSLALAESNSKLLQQLDDLKKELDNSKAQASKNPGLQFAYFSQQKTDDPSDFASKSWLLD